MRLVIKASYILENPRLSFILWNWPNIGHDNYILISFFYLCFEASQILSCGYLHTLFQYQQLWCSWIVLRYSLVYLSPSLTLMWLVMVASTWRVNCLLCLGFSVSLLYPRISYCFKGFINANAIFFHFCLQTNVAHASFFI